MSTIMLLIFSADHRENLNCQEVTEAEELKFSTVLISFILIKQFEIFQYGLRKF